MDRQPTFSDLEDACQRRKPRRAEFLEKMDAAIPWDVWVPIVEAAYYGKGRRGRPARDCEQMLRMLFLQRMLNLSDEGAEDEVLDSRAARRFVGVALDEQVPDATTLARFRHLIEDAGLDSELLDALNALLEGEGVMMRGGSAIDASFVEAAGSTKNSTGERDPEMAHGRKGNVWHFGMKVHTGVDAGSGLVHTVEGTPANVADVTQAHLLVRPDDRFAYADSGYTGVERREEVAGDEALSQVEWVVARKPSTVKGLGCGLGVERRIESRKASVRAKVEHPFLIVKRQFGYARCRFRGIRKNLCALRLCFALANVVMCMRAGRLPAAV